MKKLSFLLFLIGIFYSCSDENDLYKINNDSFDYQQSTRSGGDGKFDVLGYGYDITGTYLDGTSVKGKVLDIEKLLSTFPEAVDFNASTSEYTDFFYGVNAVDYLKELNKGKGHGLSADILGFTSTVNKGNTSASKIILNNRYSFASSETKVKLKQWYILRKPIELHDFVSKDFATRLNILSAEEIIEYYGTHVLLDISLGGRLFTEYVSEYVESSDYEMKKNQVKGGLNLGLFKIGLNTDKATTFSETIAKRNIKQNLHITTQGGSKGIDVSYDFVADKSPINISVKSTEWKNSVYSSKGINVALVDVNWNRTFFIYEFIKDCKKREEVKNAVSRYINDRQITMYGVTALYNVYHTAAQDDISYTDYNMVQYRLLNGCTGGNIIGYVYDKNL